MGNKSRMTCWSEVWQRALYLLIDSPNRSSRVLISARRWTSEFLILGGAFRIIRRNLFWTLWSLRWCVLAQLSQIGIPYSITGRMICL